MIVLAIEVRLVGFRRWRRGPIQVLLPVVAGLVTPAIIKFGSLSLRWYISMYLDLDNYNSASSLSFSSKKIDIWINYVSHP